MYKKILSSLACLSAVGALAACGASTSPSAAVPNPPVTSVTSNASGGTAASANPASGIPGAGSTGQDGGGTDRRAALQAWTDCLTKNGVTVPTNLGGGGFPGGSRPDGTFPQSPDGSIPAGAGRRGGGLGTINSILAQPEYAAAAAACKSLQPTFGGGNGGGNPANRAAYQAYLACLANNGVTVPTVVTTPNSRAPRPTLDTSDPNFAAANAKCSVLLPQNGPGGPGPANPSATTVTSAA
jgi:hypothetical protein